MAKRKVRSKKVVSKNSASQSKMTAYSWLFVRLLLAVIFLYGLYRLYYKDWTQGLSIIVFDLLVYLIIKLVLRLRKR